MPGSGTADLILQNGPRFFVDDATEMATFTEAGVIRHDYPGYLATHPVAKEVLHDLATRLARDEYRFTLSVQVRTDPDRMPLDKATVLWPEDVSPYVPIADLVLARQDVSARGQAEYGQALAFNIGRVPPANRPCEESSLARARQVVYAAGAELRHLANGQPVDDPARPRPAVLPEPAPDDTIVQAVIHPAIGVARVGSSDEFFYAPEVPYPDPLPLGTYRDAGLVRVPAGPGHSGGHLRAADDAAQPGRRRPGSDRHGHRHASADDENG
ncbi:LodA/GoxA family CTQ-dependent oxidase [Actinoplanes couchii]|uniref:L-Lysine epsilon oxidase N-terminal domain-containing protein n=1 Tax=Actinoplanes couchii TaxID=403638 RepID=A0ABQ3XEN8_9ACTN|nr:LodA/GoxA family CTQ-dependent oxidase [Actinoplanes couchii]MDR6319822.1 hypothetical protein [Actinoplanes couchii]GID56957.1 hypothetical protein Aco03nite_053610 [Actinoplanes couchii]